MARYRLLFTLTICLSFINIGDTFDSDKPIRLPVAETKSITDNVLGNDEESVAFRKIQETLFQALSNSSVTKDVKNFEELMHIFDSDSGREIGKLVFQGFVVGMSHRDPDKLFAQFWNDLKGKINPQLANTISDYSDFFKGMDMFSIYSTWNKLFDKDFLGNSLANLPLGQLIDLVQPTASKYGIDMKAVINGILGKDGSKFPDLMAAFMDNFDLSSIANLAMDAFIKDKSTKSVAEQAKPQKIRKGNNNLNTLKLFKPLFANMLRNNNIDLDIEAIFDVVEPLLGGSQDLITSLLPQIMSFMGKQGEGDGMSGLTDLLPLLGQLGSTKQRNVENEALAKHKNKLESPSKPAKSIKDKHIEEKAGKLNTNTADLSGIASLLGGLTNNMNGLDTMALLGLASRFMSSKSPKKKGSKFNSKTEKEAIESGISFSTLAEMAAKMVTEGQDSSNILVKAAEQLAKSMSPEKQRPKKETKDIPKKEVQSDKVPKKYLVDVLEPVLSSIQKDTKCHSKIKAVVEFGKSVLNKKSVGVKDLKTVLLPFLSDHISEDSELANQLFSFSKSDWIKFAKNLNNDEFLKTFEKISIQKTTDIVKIISKEENRVGFTMKIMPTIDEILNSWGLQGLSLENFPARLGPMIGLITRTWDLPFNPVTLLVPLKNELLYFKEWINDNIIYLEHMSKEQISTALGPYVTSSLQGLGDFATAVEDLPCLPRTLCNLQNHPRTRLYTTRLAAIIWNFSEAFEGRDITYTIEVAKAVLNNKDCKKSFPGTCPSVTGQTPSKEPHHVHSDL